jgi:membrane protease YdiL (CAAX protease family)
LTVAAASLTLACVGTPEIPFPERSFEDLTPPTPDAREAEPGPNNPPWGVVAAVGVWIMSFVFMLVTQMGFLIGYLLYRGINLATVAEVVTKDPVAIFVAVLSIIPAHAFTLGLAWLLVTGVGKRPFLRTLGWEWGRDLTLRLGGRSLVLHFNFWLCAALAVVLLGVGLAVIKMTGNPPTELDRLIESSRATALATAFLATVTAPFVEEVIYRGVLYSALQRAAGKVWAVAIVGLIFTGIHVLQYLPSYGVIATIFLLSFVLTLIRAHTGRLLPCVVIHLVFNGIQSILIVLDPYIKHLAPENTPAPVPPPAPGALLHALVQLFQLHL